MQTHKNASSKEKRGEKEREREREIVNQFYCLAFETKMLIVRYTYSPPLSSVQLPQHCGCLCGRFLQPHFAPMDLIAL